MRWSSRLILLLLGALPLAAGGSAATLILDTNALANNATGVHAMTGATVVTRGNNTVTANGTDTVGTPYTPLSGI